MTSVRRPGRVQKIAYDATPMSTARPDVDARIGWLLAMSRLHHPDRAMGDGRSFLDALATAGCTASRSLVSRWESGGIPVSYEALVGYERALGLVAGELTSLVGYLRATLTGISAKAARPPLDPAAEEFSTRLDELLDLVEDGHPRACDWQDLGWHLAAAPLVHLRAQTWETLAHRLVHALPRAVSVAYRQLSTAAIAIADVPRARDPLTTAVAEYVTTPGAQVLADVVGLLDWLPTRKAAQLLLDLVEQAPTDGVFSLAVVGAAQKVLRGDLTDAERARLEMLVLQLWRRDPASACARLTELVATLPQGLRETLTHAASQAGRDGLEYAVETAEDAGPLVTQSLPHVLAEAARGRAPQLPSYEQDPMLTRLVREALFHRDSERRHLAALLLSASPFRDGLADEVLTLLGSADCPTQVRTRAAMLARYLVTEGHRLRALRFLDDPDAEVGTSLAQAIGHLTFTALSDQVVRASLREEWSPRERAKMYALGMSGSPALATIARSARAPGWQRTAAAWWIDHGAAVRE